MQPAVRALELWGGIECTVNRVGDEFIDQLERGGHAHRADDLDRLAELGLRTVRYPLLWERIAPRGLTSARWEWADHRMARLRALAIEPIVGLVHHGSGPAGTSLIDEDFAPALACYAGAVARRYPWVTRWTPINEPLTTARFATLYGHWYPHARDDRLFARAAMNQYRAIVLAMRAIREVVPRAQLVQTEDLGGAYGSPSLAYQVDFENERRWLTYDVLSGTLAPGDAMWEFLSWANVPRGELERFSEECCPPAILGINHYLTSERYLDDRLERYPLELHGGNGRHRYADVEAVRVNPDGTAGPGGALREAWERYRRPLAVTEAHVGCTREHQMRWIDECWRAALAARAGGVDVHAVTAWALFGAFDWSSLVTEVRGNYEPGAFDIRSPQPRPTAIAAMVRSLTREGRAEHPVLDGKGWWRTPRRLLYGAAELEGHAHESGSCPPLLVTGASGTLGSAFGRQCEARGLAHRLVSRAELELSYAADVAAVLDAIRPWAVVHAAGYVRVDDAERDRTSCERDNVVATEVLATACAARSIPVVTFSSDLVFGGEQHRPYVESDPVSPLSVYGWTKAEGERRALRGNGASLVVRASAFFGPWDDHNFVTRTVRALEDGLPVEAPADEVVSPTYVPDLVDAVLDLLIDGERRIWHLANGGAVSWFELARTVAEMAGMDASLVRPCASASLGRPAQRPTYSALGSERGTMLPPLASALERYIAARAAFIHT